MAKAIQLFAALIMILLGGQLFSQSATCYSVSENAANNQLYTYDPITDLWTLIGPTNTNNIEAIALDPNTNTLYATNLDTLGTLDLTTGDFTAKTTIGTLNGDNDFDGMADNPININDIDGLSYDPVSQILWASERNGAAGDPDLIFQIDMATCTVVTDAFGPGEDYVAIPAVSNPNTMALLWDIDDIAWDPFNGRLYMIQNNGGAGDVLTYFDEATQTVTVIGEISSPDMEGLGFNHLEQLFGTTGGAGTDAFYSININTGEATQLSVISTVHSDFESVDCLSTWSDLALDKKISTSQAMPILEGDTVCFDITIYNQGQVANHDILISDYIPTGLTLNDPSWGSSGGIATYTHTGPLAINSNVTIPICFTVDAGFSGTITNTAEITSSEDSQGNSLTDIDSNPDNINDETNVVDNEIHESGPNANEDEDDHDIETITVTPRPTCNIASNSPLCAGDNLSLSENGGDADTWSWTGPNGFTSNIQSPTINNATVSSSGTYHVTITESGITNSCSVNVIVNPNPNCNAGSNQQLTCTTTSVVLNGSSTTGGATFSWSTTNGNIVSGANSATPTVNSAGTYTLTVTDPSNGCTSTCDVIVTSDTTPPNCNAGSNQQLTCTSTSVVLNGSSTTGGVTYSWSTTNGNIVSGASTATPTVNAVGTYTLTVTDPSNGCTSTCDVIVTSDTTPPNCNAGSAQQLTCTSTSVVLNGSSTTGGATYSWSTTNGNIVSGANTATPTVNAAGTYTLTVTDPSNGCTSTCDVLITSDTTPPNCNAGTAQQLTCTITSVVLNGSSTTSGATFSWSTTNGNIVSGANTATPTVNAAGTYTLTVTDPSNGCTSTCDVIVTSDGSAPNCNAGTPQQLTCAITSVVLNGSSTTSGVTYSWSTTNGNIVSGANTATPTVNAAGTYTLTVTDPSNGCTSTCDVIVTSDTTAPNCNAGTAQQLTCTSTSVVLNGSSTTGGVTYSWSTTNGNIVSGANTATPTVNAVGTYTLTVTDPSNGCTSTCDVIVTSDTTPPNCNAGSTQQLTCTSTSVVLNGSSTTGGVTYSWSTTNGNIVSGANTATPTVNAAGTYTLTVTDPSNGCTSTCDVLVTSDTTPPNCNAGTAQQLTCTITSVVLNGSSTTGGVTYSWSTTNGNIVSGANTATPTVNAAGTYTLTVTDPSNGCTSTCDVIVTSDGSAPNCNAGTAQQLTCTTTSVVLNGSSTTSGATFSWSTTNGNIVSGANTATPTVNAAGTYTLTVTDPSNGCTSTCNVEVSENTCIYDLALIKEVVTSGPYSPGQDVTYNITVCNQGTLDANMFTITDHIPTGMTLSTNDTNGWTGGPSGDVTWTSNALLAAQDPDACIVQQIVLTIDGSFMGTILMNEAEITADDGNDVDSDPTIDDGPDTDDDLNDGADDEDFENITIGQSYDLALIKEVVTSGPYSPGQDVTYNITVCNQGTLDANMFTITDHIPTGMTLSTNDTNGWTGGPSGDVTWTSNALLAAQDPDACIVQQIVLTIDGSFMGTSLMNEAEITADDGNDVDSDPTIDDGPDTDDDLNDGADDEDFENITIGQSYDLALIKEVVTAGPYSPGQDVTYNITVCNQGTLDANMFTITDHIPTGMTLSTNDTNGWTGGPSGNVTWTSNALLAAQDPDACIIQQIVLTIDANFMGTSLMNEAEITADDGNDVDSDPTVDDGPDTDDDLNDGADDEDFENITIGQSYDLALIKEVVTAGPYSPGQDVTYNITVCNQGTLNANMFTITDHIPTGMTLSTNDTNGWTGGPSGDVTWTSNALLAAQDPDACIVQQIVLTIDANFMGTSIMNEAEITADDGDDVDSDPTIDDGPDTDDDLNDGADDEDFENITIGQSYDLALIKEVVTAGPYSLGQDVTYNITVCNQGTLDANMFTITDHIPTGMTLSTNDTNGWTGGPSGDVTWTSNALLAAQDPDACIVQQIVLTIDGSFMGTSLMNEAEITADDGDDVDSDPTIDDGPDTDNDLNDGADDEDFETINLGQSYDLALIKEVVTSGPYSPGQDVTYNITVCNQGTLDANMFTITDHIPTGMTLSTNDTNGWTGGPSGDVTWTSNALLAAQDPDACIVQQIVLTIDGSFMGTSLMNEAEITADDGDDVDSDPTIDDGPDTDDDLNDGADDEDFENITIGQSYDLALIKEVVTSGPYSPGQDVTYNITVCNQGTLDANMFTITDHIPTGMTLSTNDTNGWTGGPSGDVTWISNALLAAQDPDACIVQQIVLTIDGSFMGTSLMNEAEITADDGDDVDSDPTIDDGPDTDNDLNDGADDEDFETINLGQSYDLALIKEVVTSGPYSPGQDVTYNITVCNQGTLDANMFTITDHIPTGMTLSTNDTNGWTGGPSGDVTWTSSALLAAQDPDACIVHQIVLTIDASFMGTSLMNEAEITADDGDDVDSDPTIDDGPDTDNDLNDGADDEDFETINLGQSYDLALIKEVVTSGPYSPGQDVTYNITVCNQGTLDANMFTITDHIPTGMTLSTNDTNGWTGGPSGDVTWTSNALLAAQDPDACIVQQIVLTIDGSFMGTSLMNEAEITADDGDDVDSDPTIDDGPDTDDDLNDGADDEDFENITIGQSYDLALIKEVVTSGPYSPGQDVTYNITVCNQGTLDANMFTITDHIPTGMTLSTNDTNGWTGGPSGDVTWTSNALLAAQDPDACIVQQIVLTIDGSFMGTSLMNEAEITADDGNDVDSDPTIDDGPDTDDDLNDGADDEDFETINLGQSYDLALIKEVVTSGPYSPGQDVTYNITVCNQGTLDANMFTITDHIPTGMTLSTNDTNGWTGGPSGDVTWTSSALLAAQDPDACIVQQIVLTIDGSFMGTSLMNEAEITADDGDDVDSDPTIDDGPDTDNDLNDSADDEDFETINLGQSYDLALIKEVVTSGPYSPGQDVTYNITVCNQGTLDANMFTITDHIPTGMTLSTNDTNGWTGGPSGDVTWTSNALLAAQDPDACIVQQIVLTIDGSFMGTSLMNEAEITADDGDDVDSDPTIDDGPDTDDDLNDGADDEDYETINLGQSYDLALIKEVVTSGPYSPGQDVTYNITVCNQGTLDANMFTITDHIPTGMTLSTNDTNGWTGGPSGDVTWTSNALLAAQDPDACIVQQIVLTIDGSFMGTSLMNEAEITADDGDDVDSDPTIDDGPDTDDDLNDGADDEDYETINLGQSYDLALIKEVVTSGPYSPGQDVTYNITVCNQGTLDANMFTITDHIPTGMTLSTNDTNGWTGGPSGDVTWTSNALLAAQDPDACIVQQIVLTIDGSFMGTSLMNEAEITADDGDDVDSDPTIDDGPDTDDDLNDGADDEDYETINLGQSYDLALIKEVVTSGPYSPGQDVTYNITVCNQGTLDANMFTITDHIPTGMTLSTNDTNGWTGGPSGDVTWTSNALLAAQDPDACIVQQIVLTIDGSFMGTSLMNEAEITADDGDDVDSDPTIDDGPDTDNDLNDVADDEDFETINLGQSYDLALIKEVVTSGPYSLGQDVTYNITVCNQGTLDANMFTITDHIPTGMTLSTNDTNGWTGGPSGDVTWTSNALLAAQDPDACIVQQIVLTIDASFMGTSLMNEAEITADDGNDVDSDPTIDDGPDTDNDLNDGADDEDFETINLGQSYDLALIKEVVTAGPYSLGQDVTYYITVCNQGTLDANMFTITDHIPTGMTLSGNDTNGWAGGPAGDVTWTSNALLAAQDPDACIVQQIVLTIDGSFMGTSLMNEAEITADDGDDVDSDPTIDDGPDTDDDLNDGADDEDFETINLGQSYDLALIKEVVTSGPYSPGQDVTYNITVCNQGTLDANMFTITDHIPTGMTLSTNDTNGWTGGPSGDVTWTSNALLSAQDPDACIVQQIVLTIDASFMGTSLMNEAEITADDGDDVDSDPTIDDGPDTDNDLNDGADDEDLENITIGQVYDLALIKEVATAGPYTAGQDITYNITVCNQGTIDANLFTVTDHIPTGMSLSSNDTNGWTGGPTGDVTWTSTVLLAAQDPDACIVKQIVLTIDANFMGTSLSNTAEITSDDGDDVDSDPAVDDGPDTDNDLNDGADDEDLETITIGQVYDLALIKEVATAGPYTAGQDITYNITVCNQGTIDANLFTVTDHIPTGMSLSSNDTNGWTGGPTGDVTWTSTALLAAQDPDACIVQQIVLTIDANFMGTSLSNTAEITADDGDDVDSTPSIDDGPDTDNDLNDGADDEDLETITIGQVYDLALIKEVVTAGPYTAGQDVTYNITVCNQGSMDANLFTVTDHIPTGMSLSSNDTNGWTGGPTGDVTWTSTGLLAAQDPDACIVQQIVLTIDANFMGTSLVNTAEITSDDGDDVDSDPAVDDGPDTDNDLNDGADDEDLETITIGQVYDLALIKEVATAGPYTAGQDITYNITVCNQGTIDANLFTVTDHIPTGMSLSSNDTNGWTGGPTGDVTWTSTALLAAQDPDACIVQQIVLTIDANFMGTSLSNTAEITADDGDDVDSTPSIDDGPDTDNDLNDGADDEDLENITIGQEYDLALIKEVVTAGPYTAGQDVIYNITVCNQGTLDANMFTITDHIPTGMSLSTNDTNGWTGGPTGDVTWTSTGLLAAQDPDACIVQQIILTIDANFMGTSLSNNAEITNDDGDDVDSDPTVYDMEDDYPDDNNFNELDGGDDEDPELISIEQVFDLALQKNVSPGQNSNFKIWDDISYDITVFNQGTVNAYNVGVIDYIQPGQELSPNDTNNWIPDPNGNYINNIVGPIAPGGSVTISIVLRVTPEAYTLNLVELKNIAEITGAEDEAGNPVDDTDSNADNTSGNDDQTDDVTDNTGGDEDDEDPAFADLEPLDPLGYIYCDKTGRLVTGGTISVTGPGNISFGVDSNGELLDGRHGSYQFLVDAPGVYNISYSHPSNYPMSSTCLPIAGVFDPTNADGSTIDKDGLVNNVVVMGSDTLTGSLIDPTCISNPYFMSVDLQPEDPPLIALNNIPVQCIVIQSIVCEDSDGDGIAELTDSGFDGVNVYLYKCDDLQNPIANTVTSNGGQYVFDNIEAGCYRMYFEIPIGYGVINNPNIGQDGWTNDIPLNWGDCYIDGAFCLTQATASLGDYVWHDLNGDGLQDANEPGIADVRVILYDINDNIRGITHTDGSGNYLFDNLSQGYYYVKFETPNGFEITTPLQDVDSNSDSDIDNSNGVGTTRLTFLDWGEHDSSWDAGIHQCVPIGELVWYDLNENDIWDTNENGINGLKVVLYRKQGGAWVEYDTEYTGHKPTAASDDGYFKFCAPPGEYYIHIDIPPTGLVPVRAFVGGNVLSDSDFDHSNGENTTAIFTVVSGDERCDFGAGYYPMATVGDLVWMDDNADGMRQTNESLASGVKVEAYDIFNDMVGSDISDQDGKYKIDYLKKEGYYLKFYPPAGYTVTTPNNGQDDAMDSDVDHSNGTHTTPFYNMQPNTHIPNVDAGLVVGTILPVEIIEFTGRYIPELIKLEWATAHELNTSHFVVERKYGAEERFNSIGNILAKGASSRYGLDDFDVKESGTYYYRLVSIDNDGEQSISDIISIEVESKSDNEFKMYPNPAIDELNLEFNLSQSGTLIVDIFDMSGKLVQHYVSTQESLSQGNYTTKLDISKLLDGVYKIQIQINESRYDKKLIVLKN